MHMIAKRKGCMNSFLEMFSNKDLKNMVSIQTPELSYKESRNCNFQFSVDFKS